MPCNEINGRVSDTASNKQKKPYTQTYFASKRQDISKSIKKVMNCQVTKQTIFWLWINSDGARRVDKVLAYECDWAIRQYHYLFDLVFDSVASGERAATEGNRANSANMLIGQRNWMKAMRKCESTPPKENQKIHTRCTTHRAQKVCTHREN